MIINESGGSRRSIYSEFGNKQELLKAVLKRQISSQLDVLGNIDYQQPVDEALKTVCTKFVKGFLSSTMVALFRLISQVVVKMPEIGELIYQAGPLRGPTPLADYLQYLANKGQLVVEDKNFSAKMLIEMCKGRLHVQAILRPKVEVTTDEIVQHVDKAVNMFLKAHRV